MSHSELSYKYKGMAASFGGTHRPGDSGLAPTVLVGATSGSWNHVVQDGGDR